MKSSAIVEKIGGVVLKRIIAVILLLATVICCFSGCDDSTEQATVKGIEIRLLAVKNTAGIGLANLMEMNKNGKTTNKYKLTTFNLLSMEKSQMATSEWDIAVIPTNEASMFYKKKKGALKILATCSTGGYEILGNALEFNGVTDLKGKTVYLVERDSIGLHTLKYILNKSGMNADEDISIEYASDIKTLSSMIGEGQVSYAVLSSKEAAEAKSSNKGLASVNLGTAWSKVSPDVPFLSYCVVADKTFAEKNAKNIDVFLTELKESVNKAKSDVQGTAKLATRYDLADSESVAKEVIPSYKFSFLSGKKMKTSVVAYFNILRRLKERGALIGRKMPGDDFYYLPSAENS